MRYYLPAAIAAFMLGTAAQAATTTYPALQSTIKYSSTATTATGYGNFARATSKVVYDPATDTYTLRDTGSLTTMSSFGPANIASATTNFTTYRRTGGGVTETFRLLNQDPANTLIALSYVDYGQWRRSTTSGAVTTTNDTYVVFGSKTAGANVPRVGSASYSTVLDGTFLTKTGVYAVTGTGNINADFAGGLLSYDATATGARESGGSSINFGTMTGSGAIAFNSASFTGAGTVNGSNYSMDINGNFYGPAAQEVGGVFRLRGFGTSAGNGTGAFVGN